MEKLDLVCGPADPLPEATKSFRLIERLGSGGQADVYKAVRRSGGISSAPVTLKVFRPHRERSLEAQYRSWDKGDAVHMDLGGRGVTGICRRIDAFYGPPPHRPDGTPAANLVPYQVLEYLPGNDLKYLIQHRPPRPVNAVSVLRTIAGVLDSMHRPNSAEIHPAIHMDIKPSNVIVMPSGEARVIDFTGARYALPSHMTTISYTPEAAGPEARKGRVGPSYDVHGFGAVAFFLVTGSQPRIESNAEGRSAVSLYRDPVLEGNPRLRDHLLAPLADDPRDRPPTAHLDHWISGLAKLMRDANTPDLGVDWGNSPPAATTRLPQPPAHDEQATKPDLIMATTELPSTRRMAGANRGGTAGSQAAGGGTGAAATAGSAAKPDNAAKAGSAPTSGATRSGTIIATASVPVAAPPGSRYGRGVAVPTQSPAGSGGPATPRAPEEPAEPKRSWTGPNGKFSALSGGSEFSVVGVLFAFLCWGIWAIDNIRSSMISHIMYFVLVLIVAVAVFAMARLLGTMVLVRLLRRNRRTARLSHLAAAVFLVVTGVDFLSNVTFISNAINWLSNLL